MTKVQIITKDKKKKKPKTVPQLSVPSSAMQLLVRVQSNIILYQSSPVEQRNNKIIA